MIGNLDHFWLIKKYNYTFFFYSPVMGASALDAMLETQDSKAKASAVFRRRETNCNFYRSGFRRGDSVNGSSRLESLRCSRWSWLTLIKMYNALEVIIMRAAAFYCERST